MNYNILQGIPTIQMFLKTGQKLQGYLDEQERKYHPHGAVKVVIFFRFLCKFCNTFFFILPVIYAYFFISQMRVRDDVLKWVMPKILEALTKFLARRIGRKSFNRRQFALQTLYSDMKYNEIDSCDSCDNNVDDVVNDDEYHHLVDQTNYTSGQFRREHLDKTLADMVDKLPKNIFFPKSDLKNGQCPSDFIRKVFDHCLHQLKQVDAHKHSFYVENCDGRPGCEKDPIPMWPETPDTPEELKLELEPEIKKLLPGKSVNFLKPLAHLATPNSTFCAHCEIFFVGALNFHCAGAAKFWIIIPDTGNNIEKFKEFLKSKYHHTCEKVFVHRTVMLTLQQLREAQVEFSWTMQYPGEYLLVCHKAIHMGFNLGVNLNVVRFWVGREWPKYAVQYDRCFEDQEDEEPSITFRDEAVKHLRK